MAIPDYQTLMLPLLKQLADGREHRLPEVRGNLAAEFRLTSQELDELLPSGTARIFYNRLGWAQTYLKKSALLDNPRRGVLIITERGKQVLLEAPQRIDAAFLSRFSEFREFISGVAQGEREPTSQSKVAQEIQLDTPEELLETAHQTLRDGLASELLATIKGNSSEFFERLVVDLLVRMGYGGSRREAGQAVGQSGDEGIDGIIKEDRLGLEAIYIQAKRWSDKSVGRPDVQGFVGALQGKRAKKGIFITTSYFTREAYEYVERLDIKVILIDGKRLANLMIETNVGVMPIATYEVKKIDLDYFSEE